MANPDKRLGAAAKWVLELRFLGTMEFGDDKVCFEQSWTSGARQFKRPEGFSNTPHPSCGIAQLAENWVYPAIFRAWLRIECLNSGWNSSIAGASSSVG